YFCSVDPTWKLISLAVPPMNLPLIRLPFFNSNVSAHATDVARVTAITSADFSLCFIMPTPKMFRLASLVYENCKPAGDSIKAEAMHYCCKNLGLNGFIIQRNRSPFKNLGCGRRRAKTA